VKKYKPPLPHKSLGKSRCCGSFLLAWMLSFVVVFGSDIVNGFDTFLRLLALVVRLAFIKIIWEVSNGPTLFFWHYAISPPSAVFISF
jgi:hypothetical protein